MGKGGCFRYAGVSVLRLLKISSIMFSLGQKVILPTLRIRILKPHQ